MTDLLAPDGAGDIRRLERQANRRVWMSYAAIVAVALVLFAVARQTAPRPLVIGLVILILTVAVWMVKPLLGMYATLFFTFIGDQVTSPWYGFTKGMSAHESMMFVDNKLIISPLEVCMAAGVIGLLVSYLRSGQWPFRWNRMSRTVAVFAGFLVLGVLYGIGTGGSPYFALFQVRPFINLIVIFALVSAVCRTRTHFRHMLWVTLAGIEIHGVLSLLYIESLTAEERKFPEGIVNHAGVMRMDILILVVVGAWLLKGNSWRLRLVTTVMSIPVMVVYLAAERRSAIVALAVAIVLLLVVLFWRQRSTFRKLAATLLILVVGYLGAFWNSQSSVGFPAQALKSVISPDETSARDQGSDMYRTIETYDLNFTIRSNPVTGLGIGKPFYRPVPLPTLGGFAYNAYIPHNSILFLWVAFGFGGFAAFFCLIGRSLIFGADAIRGSPAGVDLLVITTWVLSIVLLVVFAGVDIAWEHEDLVLLGAALGVVGNYPIARRPLRLAPKAEAEETVEAPALTLV